MPKWIGNPDVTIREEDGNLHLAYDRSSGRALLMNTSSHAIWAAAASGLDEDAIIRALTSSFVLGDSLEGDALVRVVSEHLSLLGLAGFLLPVEEPTTEA